MIETQASICAWADATVGPATDNFRIVTRANLEMAELLHACSGGAAAEKIAEEAANVMIVLARLGRNLGLDVVRLMALHYAWRDGLEVQLCACEASRMLSAVGECLRLRPDGADRYRDTFIRNIVHNMVTVGGGYDRLGAAVDAKMETNRARQWHVDGTGHGSHVKTGGAP